MNAVDHRCFWYQDPSNSGTMKANGEVIAELEGLDFGAEYCAQRSLAIAVDYASTSIGNYAGPQYLWLGINSTPYAFRIPNVAIGQKMTFVVESHRNGSARGIGLYAMDENGELQLIGDTFTPDAQETRTWEFWTLPEGVTDPDGDGLIDIYVKPTSGCHIYLIEIGENTDARDVAYLYNGSLDADLGYQTLSADYMNKVTAIEANKTFTVEDFDAYQAVVIITHRVSGEDPVIFIRGDLRAAVQLPRTVITAGLPGNDRMTKAEIDQIIESTKDEYAPEDDDEE